jgi:hypothetical protein
MLEQPASASAPAVDTIKISITGVFTETRKFQTRLEGSLLSALNAKRHKKPDHHGDGLRCGMWLPADLQDMMAAWTPDADAALLEHVNTLAATGTGAAASALFRNPGLVALPKQYLTYRGASIAKYNILDVQIRLLLFEALNKSLEELLPIVNLRNPDPHSLGAMIRKCNRYVFMSLKQPLLERMITATAAPSGPGIPAQLSLDNFKVISSRDKSEKDPSNSQSCFVQAFRQLQSKDSAVFRHTFSGDRVFQITFAGESGIDAGGVFREGVSRIVEDLFSEHFNLLLLCPNGQHEVHTNMDKYVPNPTHTGPLAMQMFEFMGKLMGMSLRAKLCLPFELPSIIWKKLVGEDVVTDDLMATDAITCKLLQAVRCCEDDGICDQESFEAKYGSKLRFVHTGSDGVERELGRGMGDRLVTFDSRLQFCDLVESARLVEFDKQVAAIERGLGEVVPSRVLQLFSWQQLEILVSGNPTFDLDLWKSKTEASGLTPKTAKLFWKVIASLTPKEQAGFVRFAWGRSRLPPAKDFTTKMKLTAGHGTLPVAHTCFFSVEMPEYATEEEMRSGLLTAINFGVGGILIG